MSVSALQTWIQSNGADPVAPAYAGVPGGPQTLSEAVAVGHDSAVLEALNRIRPGLEVSRGIISASEFLASWTPAADAKVTPEEHRWLALQLAAGSINCRAPAVEAFLVAAGLPLVRPASIAEVHLDRPAELGEIAALVGRRFPRREHKKAPENDGTISMTLEEDGVEVERRPHPDGLAIAPALVAEAKGMSEGELAAAAALSGARVPNVVAFRPPTPKERDDFVASRKVTVTGPYPNGAYRATTFAVKGGIDAWETSADRAIEVLMRAAHREGW